MSPEDRLRELRDPDRWEAVRVPRSDPRRAGAGPVRRARTAELVAAFTIAIVVAAGLLVGLATLHGSTPPASPTTAASTSVPTAVPTAKPAVFTVVPGPRAVYSNQVLPSPCALSQLRTSSKQDGGAALGTYYQRVFVLNTGRDCLLPSDAIRVGGVIASSVSVETPHGLLLPSSAVGMLSVAAAVACQPTGAKANIDTSKPVLPIVLAVGGRSRTMTARFPKPSCYRSSVYAVLDDGTFNAFPQLGLVATIDRPAKTPGGMLQYDAAVGTTGGEARVLTACPTATEVLSDQSGAVITRRLTLRCTIGATIEPDVPVSVPVSTTVPTGGDWTISWYLGGGATAPAASSTCSLDRLQVSEPGPGGAAAGNWVQLVTVRDRGAACVLPATAFSVQGRVARAARQSEASGFVLAAGSTTRFAVAASTTCPDGTMNITSIHALGSDAKPVVLGLGGQDASGLDQPFPHLHCANPYVDRLD